MTTKIMKWGNSLAVRIPREITSGLNMQEGTLVSFFAAKNQILIKTVLPKKYTLDDVVSAITPNNIHLETDWDAPVGKEIW